MFAISLALGSGAWFLEAVKMVFPQTPIPEGISQADWHDWRWQLRSSLKSREDFARSFDLSDDELAGFEGDGRVFQIRSTPYYAALASKTIPQDPIRRILMPTGLELTEGAQAMLDPLGEKQHNPAPRIIHRYPDRALFLVTDTCSVYCRYCTRKHFTGGERAFVKSAEYDQALSYIRSRTGLREVILSGGDPLTLSDGVLERVLADLRSIEHVEIIRIGSRMPVVCPMRVTPELVGIIRKYQPVFMMTHFNHPRELTREAADALALLVDNGIPVFNQLVLLNGVNNHAAIVQALSRRLLFLRVKPYYMFQCDPSEGTDHLRTSVDESLAIQRELWGRLSGLAMPNLSLDLPGGGGKAGLVPNFEVSREGARRSYVGWDGFKAEYVDPSLEGRVEPLDAESYFAEWDSLKSAKES
jgi:lysine 2,3-aminomutase